MVECTQVREVYLIQHLSQNRSQGATHERKQQNPEKKKEKHTEQFKMNKSIQITTLDSSMWDKSQSDKIRRLTICGSVCEDENFEMNPGIYRKPM